MKIGDLVRWTYPGAEAIGIVVGRWSEAGPGSPWSESKMLFHWFGNPDEDYSGPYDVNHKYMELINEAG